MHNTLKFLDNGTNTGKPSIIAYETCGLHISPVCDTVVVLEIRRDGFDS